jgi:hypothetical protein
MLGQSFQTEFARLQDLAAANLKARAQRDDFIQTQFPLLDTAFAQMTDTATGSGPALSVVHTPATETITGHTFTTLTKTVTTIQSKLYGPPETLTFTPALESIDTDQFAIIKIAFDGPISRAGNAPNAQMYQTIQTRGILMRGSTSAHLVVPVDGINFTDLIPSILEKFLTGIFIRTG